MYVWIFLTTNHTTVIIHHRGGLVVRRFDILTRGLKFKFSYVTSWVDQRKSSELGHVDLIQKTSPSWLTWNEKNLLRLPFYLMIVRGYENLTNVFLVVFILTLLIILLHENYVTSFLICIVQTNKAQLKWNQSTCVLY